MLTIIFQFFKRFLLNYLKNILIYNNFTAEYKKYIKNILRKL